MLHLFLDSLLSFLDELRRPTVDRLPLQGLLDLLLLKSVDLFDPVLQFLALLLEPQVELALQLDGLLFLGLALGDLLVVSLQLGDDLLFLELELPVVPLDLLRAFELLVRLLLVVNLPSLLIVAFLLMDSFLRLRLLLLQVLKQLVAVQLLDLRADFEMVTEPLLVGCLNLPLLVLEQLFAVKQLLVEFLDRVAELTLLDLELLHLLLLCSLSDSLHAAIGVLGHLDLLVQSALVRVN